MYGESAACSVVRVFDLRADPGDDFARDHRLVLAGRRGSASEPDFRDRLEAFDGQDIDAARPERIAVMGSQSRQRSPGPW